MEPWAAAKRALSLVWQCHQLLYAFLAKDNLPRVSRQSRRSTNDNSDNGMIPVLCADHLDFTLQLRKNSGNPTPENLGCKTVWWRLCNQASPQMSPLSPNSVGRIVQHVRKGERKEGEGFEGKDLTDIIYRNAFNWLYHLNLTTMSLIFVFKLYRSCVFCSDAPKIFSIINSSNSLFLQMLWRQRKHLRSLFTSKYIYKNC